MSPMSQPNSTPFPPAGVPSLPFFLFFFTVSTFYSLPSGCLNLLLLQPVRFGSPYQSQQLRLVITVAQFRGTESHIRSRTSVLSIPLSLSIHPSIKFLLELVEVHFPMCSINRILARLSCWHFCNQKTPSLCGAQKKRL